MNTSPSDTDIMAALRQSGYLMEQRVATQLEALDLHVWTNWAFQDPDEGKSREMDVRAIKQVAKNEQTRQSAFLELIVECKNSANPMVFIGRPKNAIDRRNCPEELLLPGKKASSKDFFGLGFDRVHYDFLSDTKAVQFCQINRAKNNKWQAVHDRLYDSLFYPMAKALTARKRELFAPVGRRNWNNFWLFVPMIVTSADIYYVDSTLPEPEPEGRDYVTFKREIRSGSLDGTFSVNFVRQDRIDQFFADCLVPLTALMIDLTMKQGDMVSGG
ncbi:MAG: hypothetical protein OXF79_19855 [Chloroflexi bacterium]|nr:hypothetical protein [Chloroflexota bacterium]